MMRRAILVLALILASCSSPDLHEIAASEIVTSSDASTPPGLVIERPGPNASVPLDEAMERLHDIEVRADREPPANQVNRDAALRYYVAGRTSLAAGEVQRALEELENATNLDPGGAEPWLAFAEAQFVSGDRLRAMISYRNAVERGVKTARAPAVLGLHLIEQRRRVEGASYLVHARRTRPGLEDPALPFVIDAALGEACIELGYLRAGTELLRRGLETPAGFGQPTRYRVEFLSLLRRKGELWVRTGDALLALDDIEGAVQAYRRASTFDLVDPAILLPRRLYTALRQGRDAGASVILLDDLDDGEALPGRRHLDLMAFLSRETAHADQVADAIEARNVDEPSLSARVMNRLLKASVLTGDRQAEVLMRTALDMPTSEPVLRMLLETSVDDEARADRASRIVRARPESSPYVAQSLLRAADDVLETIELVASSSPLLASYLRADLGWIDEAWMTVRDEPDSDPHRLLAKVRFAYASGRYDEAARLHEVLRTSEGPYVIAESWQVLQESEQALAVIEGVEPATPLEALQATELHLATGRIKEAEDLLRGMLASDRYDERAFAGLIALYRAEGPLADDERLSEMVRTLRERLPSSRLLRWLHTQELVQRGLLSQAEDGLRALTAEDPLDQTVMQLLSLVWERSGDPAARADALEWVESIEAKHRGLPAPIAMRARLLAADGRPEEGIALLEGTPFPQLQRLHESILRDQLGRPDEADAMAVRRLAPEPRGLSATLELATMLVRLQAWGDAREALDGLPRTRLTDEAQRGAASVLAAAAQTVQGGASREDVLGLFEQLMPRLDAPVMLHNAYFALLLSVQPLAEDRIVEAAKAAIDQHPDFDVRPLVELTRILLAADATEAARSVLATACEGLADPGTALFAEWIQAAAETGPPSEVRRLVAALTKREQVGWAVQAMTGEEPPEDERTRRIEFLYLMGNMYSSAGRADEAADVYRMLLREAPTHAMANNNLGYHLLETGASLDEAERYLEAALDAEPDDPSILDSLGWLRYHQGILEDTDDREGALSLLRRAAATEYGSTNPTILDHLGDALWRSGDRIQARISWRDAERHAIPRARSRGGAETESTRYFSALRDRIQTKLNRDASGDDPGVERPRGLED